MTLSKQTKANRENTKQSTGILYKQGKEKNKRYFKKRTHFAVTQ